MAKQSQQETNQQSFFVKHPIFTHMTTQAIAAAMVTPAVHEFVVATDMSLRNKKPYMQNLKQVMKGPYPFQGLGKLMAMQSIASAIGFTFSSFIPRLAKEKYDIPYLISVPIAAVIMAHVEATPCSFFSRSYLSSLHFNNKEVPNLKSVWARYGHKSISPWLIPVYVYLYCEEQGYSTTKTTLLCSSSSFLSGLVSVPAANAELDGSRKQQTALQSWKEAYIPEKITPKNLVQHWLRNWHGRTFSIASLLTGCTVTAKLTDKYLLDIDNDNLQRDRDLESQYKEQNYTGVSDNLDIQPSKIPVKVYDANDSLMNKLPLSSNLYDILKVTCLEQDNDKTKG